MKAGATAIGGSVLADLVFDVPGRRSLAHNALIALAASLLLWAAAKARIDIGVVPVTLQSLAVLTLGAALGPRLAAAAVLAYLAQGALGLPVFAGTPEKGIGLAYMMGPTGGYLVGFLLAAVAIGWLAQRGADRSPVRMFLAMLASTALIYVPGVLWLAAFVGLEKAVALGVAPFLAGDVIKAALAAAAFPALWALARRL
jgi:biotin transport system substrate-specific component